MNARTIIRVLLIALPIAATSFLGGYIKTAPASGFKYAKIAVREHRFECVNGTVHGWLRVRFDPPLAYAPQVTLSEHRPLRTWLSIKDGVQWVNISDAAPAEQQPALFVWLSGVEMHLTLPAPSRVVDWTLHRDTEKPDSASAVVWRWIFLLATSLLLLLSVACALIAPKLFETAEPLHTIRCVKMLIDACTVPDARETEHVRQRRVSRDAPSCRHPASAVRHLNMPATYGFFAVDSKKARRPALFNKENVKAW